MKESPCTTQKRAGTYMDSQWSMAAMSSISIPARLRMELRTKRRAPATANFGIFVEDEAVARSTNSSAKSRRDAKGESSTMASIMLSSSAYRSAVTAPMDRPQNAIVDVLPSARRYVTTARQSLRSFAPSVTYSPSLRPEPEKSKDTTATPRARQTDSCGMASRRAEALPCMKISVGSMGARGSSARQREHSRAWPRALCTTKSSRQWGRPRKLKRVGPRCRTS
mmetsp:Transcript_15298/g.45687  ORF Transcript_15298/g.45687 Transcript_15298/m.45687 type:complete len:224 (+) Transcript_15298:136-807(+)